MGHGQNKEVILPSHDDDDDRVHAQAKCLYAGLYVKTLDIYTLEGILDFLSFLII